MRKCSLTKRLVRDVGISCLCVASEFMRRCVVVELYVYCRWELFTWVLYVLVPVGTKPQPPYNMILEHFCCHVGNYLMCLLCTVITLCLWYGFLVVDAYY